MAIFNKIQQISPLSAFDKESVIVQNAGMQHWLNMSVAKTRGISMNIDYALPAQFLWNLLRTKATEDEVPEQSPYSREVLCWRIDALLTSNNIIENNDFRAVNDYWLGEKSEAQQSLKRYQLSQVIADLFEQYLIFRPEWIDAWCRGDSGLALMEDGSQETQQNAFQWQSQLWQMLHLQIPYNPVALMQSACENLDNGNIEKIAQLPKRISFFGINAMAPMWLSFIEKLGEHIDIHFFHLNPCVGYWGDIQSEKQAIKHLKDWTTAVEDLSHIVGNPLLANLGQQGREFVSLLQSISTIAIDAFESHKPEHSARQVLNNADKQTRDNKHEPSHCEELTTLMRVQNDILNLTDARLSDLDSQDGYEQENEISADDSITITSCHSAFREVQALHDWLLHQLNQDTSLTPKDILVMCPQIEDYAPYVNAVFTRGWQDIADDIPPLPCSIADRSSKDSDPIVAAFVDMLSFPDNRFHVSSVIGLLRVPAVARKFRLTIEDIAKISVWLEQASVHWGLSKAHKQQLISDKATNAFTWQQGLSRLMKGFAFGDSETLYDDTLTLPNVEGLNGNLLGQLMLFIEHLQIMAIELAQSRTAPQWQIYLCGIVEQVFDFENEQSESTLNNAIASLCEYTQEAHYSDEIALSVVTEFLTHHFSVPDPGRQFMVGQVTFCSMLPMRSIPFKVIAVLGLNDGQYPRQRQPLAFDLMAITPAKLGDRSRRGDDRYLFLEAIISARQSLYLSYQGRNVANNKKKEPSIVLQEFMDYLENGYQWDCQQGDGLRIRQMPLQPFSPKNYKGNWPSFDANWLALAQDQTLNHCATVSAENKVDETIVAPAAPNDIEITLEQLVRFFVHPSRWYAQKQLNLTFDESEVQPSDAETFTYDRLASYQLKQDMLAALLDGPENTINNAIDTNEYAKDKLAHLKRIAHLTGDFADSPITDGFFDKWQHDSEIFAQAIAELGIRQPELNQVVVQLVLNSGQKVNIQGNIPLANASIVAYRSSTAKAKDVLTLYCYQLLGQVAKQQSNFVFDKTIGIYFDTKSQKVNTLELSAISDAQQQLMVMVEQFIVGQRQPLLLNADIAHKYYTSRTFEQAQFEKFWFDANAFNPPAHDPYIQYFWPDCPDFSTLELELSPIYQSLYQSLSKVTGKSK